MTHLGKRDHSGDSRGGYRPLTIAVETAGRSGVRTDAGIENQSREVKRDRKPECTPEPKGEYKGVRKGCQLSTNPREHSLIQMAETCSVRNGMNQPIAIQVERGMRIGECWGVDLWLKHGGYMRVAPRVSPSVCTAVNSGYRLGDH